MKWLSAILKKLSPYEDDIYSLSTLVIWCSTALAIRNSLLGDHPRDPRSSTQFFQWFLPFFFPQHKFNVLFFILLTAGCSLITMFAILGRPRDLYEKVTRKLFAANATLVAVSYLVGAVFLLCRVISREKRFPELATESLIILVLALIFGGQVRLRRAAVIFISAMGLLFGILQISITLLNKANLKPFFYSEYVDLPEHVLIDGVSRDKHEFIREGHLWGDENLFDPRTPDQFCKDNPTTFKPTQYGMSIGDTKIRDVLIKSNHTAEFNYCFISEPSPQGLESLFLEFPKLRAFYKETSLHLKKEKLDSLTDSQRQMFSAIDEETRYVLHDLEMTFHHVFQVLTPIWRLKMGEPIREIHSLYGNSVLLYAGFAHLSGGMTFNSVFKSFFISYWAYFLTIILLFGLLTRSWVATAAFAVAVATALCGLGNHVIGIGVGFNPVRHLFDILILGVLIVFRNRPRDLFRNRNLALLSCLFSLAIFWESFFGLFLVTAFIGALVSLYIIRSSIVEKINFFPILLFLLVPFGVFAAPPLLFQPSPYLTGMWDGLWGFPLSDNIVIFLCLFSTLSCFLIYQLRRRENISDNNFFILGFLYFYSSELVLYSIQIPNTAHFFSILHWPLLFIGFAFVQTRNGVVKDIVLLTGLGLACWFWKKESINPDKDLFSHSHLEQLVVENWNFPALSASSTLSQSALDDSVQLLKKYKSSKTCLISRLDSLFLFLSETKSCVGYWDLISFNAGPLQQHDLRTRLEQTGPELIITDKGFDRNFIADIPAVIENWIPWTGHNRSIDKANKIRAFYELIPLNFRNYEIVDSSTLLVVLKSREPKKFGVGK